MNRIILLILTIILITGCQSAMNYNIKDRENKVSDFIENELKSSKFPGIQYIVLNADTTLYSYSGGFADIEANKPVQVNTTMMIYSMTKTFTAAAVLQLFGQGKISLDDPVTKYLSDIPYGEKVTIRHLLSQTSGIPNPIPLRWVHLAEEHPLFDESASLNKIIQENPELDFEPGEKYKYSNIAYWLLGGVIAKASGISYEDYVRRNIFHRLNIPPGEIDFEFNSNQYHAKGYIPKWSLMNLFKSFLIDSNFVGDYEGKWLHINDHYVNGPSFGGIIASARATGIFLQDQLRDSSQLFTKQTKSLFFEQQKNNEGVPVEISLGWHIGMIDSELYYFKEGGGGGFHCEMRIYPGPGIASVVIADNTSFDTNEFLDKADKEFWNK